MKSRMKGDLHVWFRENAGVKFPCVTRLGDSGRQHSGTPKTEMKIKTNDRRY